MCAFALPPKIILSIEYALELVLDLTELHNQEALQTNIQELTGVWLPDRLAGNIPPTQLLGLAAHNTQDIQALKVPSQFSSAVSPTSDNFVIFLDRLQPDSRSFLRVYDDSGTIQASYPESYRLDV